jgi:hypothetical protein
MRLYGGTKVAMVPAKRTDDRRISGFQDRQKVWSVTVEGRRPADLAVLTAAAFTAYA